MYDKIKVTINLEIEKIYDERLKGLLSKIIELNTEDLKIEVKRECQN